MVPMMLPNGQVLAAKYWTCMPSFRRSCYQKYFVVRPAAKVLVRYKIQSQGIPWQQRFKSAKGPCILQLGKTVDYSVQSNRVVQL